MTNTKYYGIIITVKGKVIKMLNSYYIYWGDNQISCFQLRSMKQAKSIAKQYPNVKKVIKKGDKNVAN